ncbi:ribosome-associated ATPase/putative transporter RbbA [Roseovarius sp. Pro17]|uniref:ribosome-associated ATPase/putative transporter RbbA n=1 Tax=Roseovarius sp. Pro17 TaxID=3108175 RepID=UPI002D797024|nr:ribosome-associated ATPase/putative transporter RbbA [Roseovarius sp. Pro17]
MTAPVASLRGLCQSYGAVTALDDVTLDIPAGCMAGLIGPDGVGKSTLLAIVAGVRQIQQGTAQVLGGDIADAVHRQVCNHRIAYMPQGLGRNLYPTLSVHENLDFFGRLFGQGEAERAARIDDLLGATGLSPFADRPAGKLSGGMKQKLSLCSALIHDPDLLILDEPSTGVDALAREQFWDLIDSIRQDRPLMSVIVATAYMDEAERFDWIAAMTDGRVITTGSPSEIREASGETSLEKAFVALLPEAVRKGHVEVFVPPRTATDGPPAIEAQGLTKRFGTFTAVDNVEFQIAPGEIFGFLGSNGCGKSVTMKMLTGLIPVTEGRALLFGQPLNPDDMATRLRVGYMSQSFSLYSELTVRQNLDLHAELYRLPIAERAPRVAEMLAAFDLQDAADQRPGNLPLGIRQRLQLAVAVIHKPEVLILDEPTSGVDPVARDAFWQYLIALSREDGVTIFLSTHFMIEGERCDRISFMHAGRVLAVGTPDELIASKGESTLEAAFVSYLREATDATGDASEGASRPTFTKAPRRKRRFDIMRLWAFARRETTEILRDPMRLVFAFIGPISVMLTVGYGISFDVEDLPYAALDRDQTAESRELLEAFAGSRYFQERLPASSGSELDARLKSGELALAIEVPPGFGKALLRQEQPELEITIDGAMPFRGETVRGYVQGLALSYFFDQIERKQGRVVDPTAAGLATRFSYNQAFKSVFAVVPSVIMLTLILIPGAMTAMGIVREKETGSIANFRATPVTRTEFLLGKQLPYVTIFFLSFFTLLALAYFMFGVPVTGSMAALISGSLLYLFAATGFGLLVSTFTQTQVAAIFAAIVIALVPSVSFSGLLVPVSSLSGIGRLTGLAFPSSWYQQISVGAFTKGLGFGDLWHNFAALTFFALLFIGLAVVVLKKQEK